MLELNEISRNESMAWAVNTEAVNRKSKLILIIDFWFILWDFCNFAYDLHAWIGTVFLKQKINRCWLVAYQFWWWSLFSMSVAFAHRWFRRHTQHLIELFGPIRSSPFLVHANAVQCKLAHDSDVKSIVICSDTLCTECNANKRRDFFGTSNHRPRLTDDHVDYKCSPYSHAHLNTEAKRERKKNRTMVKLVWDKSWCWKRLGNFAAIKSNKKMVY